MVSNIRKTVEYMDRLRQKSGKPIILAFEPEPGCLLQTAADMIDFMDRLHACRVPTDVIGICLDCCHHAVMFEPPGDVWKSLSEARVKIGKVQVSNAFCMRGRHAKALKLFHEDCYLHQTVVRSADGRFCQYTDLPDAIRRHHPKKGDEWRVHYHLPLFMSECDQFPTTQTYTIEILKKIPPHTLLEVETYTWSVMPEKLKYDSLASSIIREIKWVERQVRCAENGRS
jgi:hypothetical protein